MLRAFAAGNFPSFWFQFIHQRGEHIKALHDETSLKIVRWELNFYATLLADKMQIFHRATFHSDDFCLTF